MALRKSLILRGPRSGRLEGRTALVQPNFNSFTASCAGTTKTEDGRLLLTENTNEPDAFGRTAKVASVSFLPLMPLNVPEKEDGDSCAGDHAGAARAEVHPDIITVARPK